MGKTVIDPQKKQRPKRTSEKVAPQYKPDSNLDENALYPPSDWVHKAIMLTAVILPFLGFITAIAITWATGFMGWGYLAMLVIMWGLTGMGITVGFHRLLTHSSFETYRPIRAFFMICGALSIEGSPLIWCAVHRKHHQRSDQPGDPHSPHLHGNSFIQRVKGFWYAHSGWLFTGNWAYPDLQKYVPDLLKDKLLVAVDKMYYLWVLASLAIPTILAGVVTMSWKGALLGFIWGGLARVFLCHHITWSVNSVCHVFGRRPYETGDLSTNNALFGVLAWGEGWHNNHHAFPTSARHGLKWYQFDMSWMLIKVMKKLRLAWNVQLPSKQLVDTRLK